MKSVYLLCFLDRSSSRVTLAGAGGLRADCVDQWDCHRLNRYLGRTRNGDRHQHRDQHRPQHRDRNGRGLQPHRTRGRTLRPDDRESGLRPVRFANVTLTVDQALTLNTQMEAGSNQEQITVEGTAAAVDTTDAQLRASPVSPSGSCSLC